MVYTGQRLREYQNAKRNRIRQEMRDLLGGRCKCGSAENLDFDHIDPSSKSFRISQGLFKPRSILEAEVLKCQLLCEPCHVKKSNEESRQRMLGVKKVKYRHGNWAGYAADKCRCEECRAWKRIDRQRYAG